MDKKFVKDYRKKSDGTYEYTGDTYSFAGDEASFRASFFRLVKMPLLLSFCFLVCGLLPDAWFSRVYHLLIPFGIEFLVLGLFFFALYELWSEEKPLKAHIYEKTVERMPVLAGAMTILCAIVAAGIFAGLIVRLVSPESYFALGGRIAPDMAVMAVQTGMLVLARRLLRMLDRMQWEKNSGSASSGASGSASSGTGDRVSSGTGDSVSSGTSGSVSSRTK